MSTGVVPPTPQTPNLLWRWNGTDVTQFTLVSGTATIAKGVLPTIHGGAPCIYFDTTPQGVGTGRTLWTINDLPAAFPDRYILAYGKAYLGDNHQFGHLYYYESSTYWFSAEAQSDATLYRNNAGVITAAAATTPTGSKTNRVNWQSWTMHGPSSTVAAAPAPLVSSGVYPVGTNTYSGGVGGDFGAGAYDAGWVGASKARGVGIVMNKLAVATATLNYLCGMVILKHPYDSP